MDAKSTLEMSAFMLDISARARAKAEDSLSILLPRPTMPTLRRDAASSSRLLEDQSVEIITSVRDGSTNNPAYRYLSADHISTCAQSGSMHVSAVILRGCDAFVHHRAAMAAANPNISIRVLDAASHIHSRLDRATVWITCRMSRFQRRDLKARESVAVLDWD